MDFIKTIGIDSRLYGLENTGIGRYIKNLIHELAKLETNLNFNLFVAKKNQIKHLPPNFKQIDTPIKHYSLKEQLLLPGILKNAPSDLYHFPHFNIPLMFNLPFVTTIHDILWHQKIGLKATSLNPIIYMAKYAGYRQTIKHAATASQHIIVPSNHVKNQIHTTFNRPKSDISVTYEAASQIFFQKPKQQNIASSFGLKLPFVVYTGSLYPHKNVNNLILALKQLPQVNLAIVSARNIFQQKTKNFVSEHKLNSQVKFLGFVPDQHLVSLYHQATALIQPSESEGFGLTGLEALAAGLPVICSHNPVLKEIYQDRAIYTDSTQPNSIAASIQHLLDSWSKITQIKKANIKHAKQYSWTNLAKQTLNVYQNHLPD